MEILLNAEGDVRGMQRAEDELGEPDERGRRKPVPLDEFVELECDTVIYALGTKPNPIIGQATPGLGLNKLGQHRRPTSRRSAPICRACSPAAISSPAARP